MQKFHGTKVLGTFATEERKFHRSKSSMERKFLDFLLPRSECSTARKFHGSESSLYGLFAPGNESAEERKGQLPICIPRTVTTNAIINVTTSVLNFSFFLNDVIVLLGFYLSWVCQASIPLYTTVQLVCH